MVIAIEARRVAGIDRHRSTKAFIRASTNTSGAAAHALVRRARACRDRPAIGEALAAGYIGVAQVDALARAHFHPRVGDRFDEALPAFLEHAEHFPRRDLELLLDSDGTRIDFGREVRLFRGNAAVAARPLAKFCEWPGCDIAGRHSDVDHNLEWNAGGHTVQKTPTCSTPGTTASRPDPGTEVGGRPTGGPTSNGPTAPT